MHTNSYMYMYVVEGLIIHMYMYNIIRPPLSFVLSWLCGCHPVLSVCGQS